jgi:glycosyltransferase involved in cell wall biosynthesis
MRVGANPLRSAQVKGYTPIVLAVITHLPNMEDYHEHRLNVIKCTLETMRANAGCNNFQIMVWDNGSCDALLHWLKRSYQPDYLVTSPNVGKSIARASIVRMLPPKTVVGVSDDDMFFYPDWLKAHLEVLTVYPNVGTVSGWPVRTQFRFHNKATLKWGQRFAGKFERGHFISPQEDMDFCTSIGRDYNYQVNYTQFDTEVRLSFRGVDTYATGHHCQWIGVAGVVAPYVAYTPDAMADERPFEKAIDQAELLRLTTFKRYARHIGNVLDPELEELWRKLRS